MKEYEWLKNLKAGDKVIIAKAYSGQNEAQKVQTVEKITPKGSIKVDNKLYSPENGDLKGNDSWIYIEYLKQATSENIEKIKQEKVIRICEQKFNTTNLTYDQAVKILEVLGYKVE